jgi:hypothetical protein
MHQPQLYPADSRICLCAAICSPFAHWLGLALLLAELSAEHLFEGSLEGDRLIEVAAGDHAFELMLFDHPRDSRLAWIDLRERAIDDTGRMHFEAQR